jgi:hypothetical protein
MAQLRRRLKRLIAPIGAVALLLVLVMIGSNCNFGAEPEPPPPSATPDCDRPRPFPESCEGVWLRAVVEKAGYSITDEGSNAWGVATGKNEFYFWATQAQGESALEDFLGHEGYDVHLEFGQGVVHLSSKGHRYVWETQGLLVWIGESTKKVTNSVLERLLIASLQTPYPPLGSGSV